MSNTKSVVHPVDLTLQVRMPDGTYWNINGESLLEKMLSRDKLEIMSDDIKKLLDQFSKDPEGSLLQWSESFSWSEIEDIATQSKYEQDYTLGWKHGQKCVFKK